MKSRNLVSAATLIAWLLLMKVIPRPLRMTPRSSHTTNWRQLRCCFSLNMEKTRTEVYTVLCARSVSTTRQWTPRQRQSFGKMPNISGAINTIQLPTQGTTNSDAACICNPSRCMMATFIAHTVSKSLKVTMSQTWGMSRTSSTMSSDQLKRGFPEYLSVNHEWARTTSSRNNMRRTSLVWSNDLPHTVYVLLPGFNEIVQAYQHQGSQRPSESSSLKWMGTTLGRICQGHIYILKVQRIGGLFRREASRLSSQETRTSGQENHIQTASYCRSPRWVSSFSSFNRNNMLLDVCSSDLYFECRGLVLPGASTTCDPLATPLSVAKTSRGIVEREHEM